MQTVSKIENVSRHELAVKWPVRIVQTKDRPFYCATDLGRLFCLKKPYDDVKHYFKGAVTKILIPCKQNPDYSRTLCFLCENQARTFIRKQLERKTGEPIRDEWAIDVFLLSLKKGEMPTALKPKTIPLTPEEAARMDVPKGINNIDLQTAFSIIKLYKQFVKDTKMLIGV